jgi:uncharacterized protein YgbK (DUF1537 family)
MPRIGVVADDLTGATTCGILLARSGARTAVYFDSQAIDSAYAGSLDAVLISSNSRSMPGNLAYEKVRSATEALKSLGVEYFSKRIDTTLRGNLGVEIDTMMNVLGQVTISLVVPAMPQSRRTVVGGFSLIDGEALARTPAARDVRTPVHESYVPRLLSNQTKRKIDLIKIDTVLNGAGAISEALTKSMKMGSEIIVVDAISLEDVDAIANACVQLNWNILAVDPGAFTARLAFQRGLVKEEASNMPDGMVENRTALLVAGSATSTTRRQLDLLCANPENVRIGIDPLTLIKGGEDASFVIKQAVERACGLLSGNPKPRSVLLETSFKDTPLNLNQIDRNFALADGTSAERINNGLGTVAAEILEKAGTANIAGLYITGGDTMLSVCEHIGVRCIELVDYVIAQTDIGRLVGKYEGLPIICKGGLTGHDRIVIDIVDRLFREAVRSER